MLLDRQLADGGWNYGNTSIFGTELYPMPDATGLALKALAGHVTKNQVDRSLNYLKTRVQNLKTPFSLAWALLGLGAWDETPLNKFELIDTCLSSQQKFGGYTTTNLSLLTLASSGNMTP
jgi:hypothetical protein